MSVMDGPGQDTDRAAAEQDARRRLLESGATDLPRAPWLRGRQPPADVDLVRFAVWRAASGAAPVQDVEAALALLTAARAEVDQLEAAVLFAARSEGLPWSRISRAMGLGSAQAAAQRYDRVSGRVPTRTESSR
jgi:hypothetical protein